MFFCQVSSTVVLGLLFSICTKPTPSELKRNPSFDGKTDPPPVVFLRDATHSFNQGTFCCGARPLVAGWWIIAPVTPKLHWFSTLD